MAMREVSPGRVQDWNWTCPGPRLSKAESTETHTHWAPGQHCHSRICPCGVPAPARLRLSAGARSAPADQTRAAAPGGPVERVTLGTHRLPNWGRGQHQLLQKRVSGAGRRGCPEGFWHRAPDRSQVQSIGQPGQKSTQCDRVRKCGSPEMPPATPPPTQELSLQGRVGREHRECCSGSRRLQPKSVLNFLLTCREQFPVALG